MKCLTSFAVCAIAAVTFVGSAQGQEAKKADAAKKDVIETYIAKDKEGKCCFGACAINYRKELGVPLGFLDTLGNRIHQARRSPDPVELAMIAQDLAVAEKVSGKKAAITSDDVLKDALQIVKLRDISQELAAVSLVVTDEKAREELSNRAEVAREREQAAKAALSKGEATKEIVGTLQVINHSNECLRIFVDHRFVGEVHMGETAHLHVHSHRSPNHLEAYCEEGGELVKCAHFWGSSNFVSWHIH